MVLVAKAVCAIFAMKFYHDRLMDSKYELVSVAYRSRLLFRSDSEYREALGASFETIFNKRDSVRDMDVYCGILERELAGRTDRPMSEVIGDYISASEAYLSLDWSDRTQMASRKRFCRMLFRIVATAGKGLTPDDESKFKAKDADEKLLGLFFPDGVEEMPAVDVGFVMLFAFGVVRPWKTDSFRGRDIGDKETVRSLERLRDLIGLLKDDTPRLGSLRKPLVFDEWLEIIGNQLDRADGLADFAPLAMAVAMWDIIRACRSLVVSEQQRIEGEKFQGLYMHGIWVDDADGGRDRFWIFPDNCLAALCYRRENIAWELEAYDFRVRQAYNSAYMDSFILLAPHGNLNFTLSPDRVIADEQMASGSFEEDWDEEASEIVSLTLYEEPRRFPGWLNWRKWERLAPDDPRYAEFRAVLRVVYDLSSPHSRIFRNTAPELTDNVNNFVGRDKKYLYVFDWQPKRFVVKEKTPDSFTYEGEEDEYATEQSLLELPVTEANPLYAIPLRTDKRDYGDSELNRFAEILTDAENITEVHVIHSRLAKYPRLVFPSYGTSVTLNMVELSKLGVKRFTSRPF